MSRASDNQATETAPVPAPPDLAPADYCDPVIEAYKKDVDRTLLRENLKLTVEQRFQKHEACWQYAQELRGIAWKQRRKG
jgi:hypothetical protein